MSINKIISLNKLGSFLAECKKIFAPIIHAHKLSDITDYTVDSAISSSSINPVQNKVLNAEFDAIATAMGALETAIDGKANMSDVQSYINETILGGEW